MIARIIKSGKKFKSDNIAMYFGGDAELPRDKYAVAFLVAKAAGNAVRRNQIKRWLREDFSGLQNVKPLSGGFVVRFFGDGGNVDHIGLTKSLDRLYSRVIENA